MWASVTGTVISIIDISFIIVLRRCVHQISSISSLHVHQILKGVASFLGFLLYAVVHLRFKLALTTVVKLHLLKNSKG